MNHYLAKDSKKNWIIIWFFFDFRTQDCISNRFDGLLRSFLLQLSLRIPELSPLITEYGMIETSGPSQPDPERQLQWNKQKLCEALLSGLTACSPNVLMIIDGLDECESKKTDMLDMIKCF